MVETSLVRGFPNECVVVQRWPLPWGRSLWGCCVTLRPSPLLLFLWMGKTGPQANAQYAELIYVQCFVLLFQMFFFFQMYWWFFQGTVVNSSPQSIWGFVILVNAWGLCYYIFWALQIIISGSYMFKSRPFFNWMEGIAAFHIMADHFISNFFCIHKL